MDNKFCPICEREFDNEANFCPYDGSELILRSEDDMTGKIFDNRYKILHKIGEGGMGTVYKAEQIATGKHVAIKVMARRLVSDEATVRRFQREVKLQSKLEHPNIVTVIDFAKTPDGQYFFVMGFIKGASLRTAILEKGRFSIDDFFDLSIQICDGIHYAHQMGVIHRDLKSENIIVAHLGHQNVIKILDFGLAKATQGAEGAPGGDAHATELTQQGRILGTPAYMSPEQAKGDLGKIGPQSDIYALGVIFYQMLTGKLPYVSDTPWGLMHKHISEPPPHLRNAHTEVEKGLDKVLRICLAKEPEDRFPSALALRDELSKVMTHSSDLVSAEPETREFSQTIDFSGDEGAKGATVADLPGAKTVAAGKTMVAPPSEAGEHKSSQGLMVGAIFLLVAGALVVGGFLMTGKEGPPSIPAPAPQAAVEEPSGVEAPAGDTNNNKEAVTAGDTTATVTAPEDKEGKVALLLQTADRLFEEGKLSAPSGDNAEESYGAVLKIDPDNAEAKMGLDRIAARHSTLAGEASARKDYAEADKRLAAAKRAQVTRGVTVKTVEEAPVARTSASPSPPRAPSPPPAARQATLTTPPPPPLAAKGRSVSPPAGLSKARQVDWLLDQAKTRIRGGFLVTPPGDSAHSAYKAVLERDKGNRYAKKGLIKLEKIIYKRLVKKTRNKKFDAARADVKLLETYYPGSRLAAKGRDYVDQEQAKAIDKKEEDRDRRERLATEHIDTANAAMAEGDLSKARIYVRRAENLAPDLKEVREAKARLSKKTNEQ